jgi:dolichol kinase
MVGVIFYIEKSYAIMLFAFLTAGLLFFEYARRHIGFIKNLTTIYMGEILRSHEKTAFTGAFYVVLAVLVVTLFFPTNIAFVAVTIMLIADSFAAIFGKKYGRFKILDKSLEGSCAFFISALFIIELAGYYNFINDNIYLAFVIAFVITLVELASSKIRIDDNLTIVLTSAALLQIGL